MYSGGVAQLGERLPCKQEVSGSIPLISTKIFLVSFFMPGMIYLDKLTGKIHKFYRF
jgi:hypothetical protein